MGLGVEMLYAKRLVKPIVSCSPKNSHYNKDKISIRDRWIHGFIYNLSDAIVETVAEGSEWIKLWKSEEKEVKGEEVINNAMMHYMHKTFLKDGNTQEIISDIQQLKEELDQVKK